MQMVPVKALEQEVVLALLQQVQEPREAEQEQSVRVAEWLVQEQEAEPVLQAVASVVPQEHRVVSQQLALVLLVQEQLVLGVQLELVRQALVSVVVRQELVVHRAMSQQEAEPVLQAVASVVPQEHRVVSQQLALVLLVQEQLVLGVQLELVRQALQLERQLRQRALDVRLVCQHY